MHFFTILINELQYIVMYSSRKFNSPFNEWWIVWLRFMWGTQHLLEWHTPQNKSNKIESFAKKKIIATRVYMHFLPYWLINNSIYIVMYSSRKFNSPFTERRIVLLRLFLETEQFVEWNQLKSVLRFP